MASQKSAVLVIGGIGYIGSHTLTELDAVDFNLVVVDNLVSTNEISPVRIEKIIDKPLPFYKVDTCDEDTLDEVFSRHHVDQVIHFAGLKAVGESAEKPLEYYENNISGTLVLLKVMCAHECTSIVFSSSATVYGDPAFIPITEECPKGIPTNPYGWTKWMIEQMLTDTAKADPKWDVVFLCYFNPIGAHESGLIGEDPNGIPNNLVPYIAQVAIGRLEALQVFGNDCDTPDGTGVCDYIHVVDLAKGHVKALEWMQGRNGSEVSNLGTGQGYSVFEVLHVFEGACERELPYVIRPRRAENIVTCYSDPKKAAEILGWKAESGIERMCMDSWRWQSMNPNGYASSDAVSATRRHHPIRGSPMTTPTLAELTTFRVGGPIRDYLATDDRVTLIDATKKTDEAGTPLLVIGGGSNLLACDEGFEELVVKDLRSEVRIEQTPASTRA